MNRSNQELVSQEVERLALFVSSITDYAIYMLTPEGKVASWNAGAQRFKGYTAEDIIGQHFSLFYTDEDRAAEVPAQALREAMTAGKFEAEGWRVRKDGTRFWANVVIDAVRNDQGELVGFAKITRDITERRAVQLELEKAREALYQGQKMEAIGKVTGGVAHDFNNLLNVINNGLALLRRTSATPHDTRLLDTMDKALKRGATLIQQLLAFARQQPLLKEHKDLNRVIRSFESVLQRAVTSGTSVELDLADELPSIEIDTAQVETGLLNLVVNAHDAIKPPGGRIIVSTRVLDLDDDEVRKLPAGRYVAVTVADNGHGMPAHTLERATEPFFTTKEVGKGTGLGLSQVYGMTQQSGGDLTIQSEVGRGTRITMYFPASQGHVDDEVHAELEAVLVVDDQAEVLEVTEEVFKSLGFEVFPASSGEQALEILRRTPRISLLFSDVVMRGMNGVALAQEALKVSPGLKVLLASGYAGSAVASPVDGRLEGFHFLNKPYRVNDIVRKLRVLD